MTVVAVTVVMAVMAMMVVMVVELSKQKVNMCKKDREINGNYERYLRKKHDELTGVGYAGDGFW